jgi:hypothetical protein
MTGDYKTQTGANGEHYLTLDARLIGGEIKKPFKVDSENS